VGIDWREKVRDTEAIGITETVTHPEKSLPFTEIAYDWNIGRYKVKLPWKADCIPLSNGYVMCMSRLQQLQLRFKKDKSLFDEYIDMIEKQLQDSIVERITDTQNSRNCHFLPRYGVT